MSSAVELKTITTDIPARLDRLPWAKFHWLVIVGLGTVWILDGLEVTIVGSMSEALKPADTGLGMLNFDIGLAGAVYVAGGCLGALVFGQLTDRFGRKSCSSSRLPSTPSRPYLPPSRRTHCGTSRAAFSLAPGSAVSTQRSIPLSTG